LEHFTGVEDDTTFYYCTVVTCQPLTYCVLQLIPFYCVTALAAALVTGICLWILKAWLLDPLHEQAEIVETLLPPMTQEQWSRVRLDGFRWAEPATARSQTIRLQALLASDKAEITRLQTALDYAKDAEQNRKQLISNITHELKTPLAVIHSYAQGLQSGIAADKKEHYVQVILDEAERMDAMVLQMLELSRLEAGRVKLKVESFSFSDLIRYVAEKFQPLLEARNLTIRLEMEEPLTINASESRLEQVLTNFISNAVRYTPSGGQILIRGDSTDKEAFFSITNTAPHLSQEGLEKVFDSFYREDASRSEKSTGLGLAIVKGIISLHSGECYVNNTELDGESAVNFSFRIPK
jgi:signal transduction histidine kinase